MQICLFIFYIDLKETPYNARNLTLQYKKNMLYFYIYNTLGGTVKKFVIGLLVSLNVFAFNNVRYFGGVMAEGNLNIESGSLKDRQDQNYDYTAGMELEKIFKDKKYLSGGIGVKYENYFEAKSSNYGKVEVASSVPVYGFGKMIYNLDKNSKLYVKGEIGYNFAIEGDYMKNLKEDYPLSNPKLDGGLYSGIGVGLELRNISLEMIYNISRVKLININNKEYKYNYEKISATIGYKFDL